MSNYILGTNILAGITPQVDQPDQLLDSKYVIPALAIGAAAICIGAVIINESLVQEK